MKIIGRVLIFAMAVNMLLIFGFSGGFNVGAIDKPAASDTSIKLAPAETASATEAADSQAVMTTGPAEQQAPVTQQDVTVEVDTADAATLMGPPQDADVSASAEISDNSAQTSKPVAPHDKMSGPVAALIASGASGAAELVVRYDQRPELFDDELVAELGGVVVRSYEHLDMRAIRLPVASLESLAMDTNVDWLSLDDKVSTTSVASRAAANLPASSSTNAGYSGLNVGIAVLDTGVSKHADLSDSILQYSFLGGAYPTPEIANGELVTANDSARGDGYGHGTHVAGLLGGSGVESNDDYKGAAENAKLLALQVLDADGGGSMSDVMAALDWLLTYGEYFDIRIVNLSLGKGISESNQTDPLVLAVERLWDAGMVVIVAAGNDGFSGSMTINSPGNSRKAITVGSLTDNATGLDHSDDYVSSFSSQGPTIGDYVLKPDLLAPGNRLVGAAAKNSKLANALKDRLKACKKTGCGEEEYLELSGTSMATPMVSAVVALMLDKDPTLSPATVKARLMRSALKIDADPTEAGAGLLDADAALNDSGVLVGDALSPLMIFDELNNTVLIEDTAALWGDDLWGSAYLFNNGATWASGAAYTDEDGVTANGYVWTDGGVAAKGYQWTDGGIGAKGYQWTDGVDAKSLLEGSADTEFLLNDDGPGQ
jgi:serine protease AprX